MIKIQGLEDYSFQEIQNIVFPHIRYLREHRYLEGLDFSVQDISLIGSRITGYANKYSDFDIKIKYIGSAREDDVFNALNDKEGELRIENIKVDFYPEKA